jgi:aldehyde dehydrogenase (NAD+)
MIGEGKQVYMQSSDYAFLLTQQRQFFNTAKTFSISFRLQQLNLLKSILKTNEKVIADALSKDLNKPPTESIVNEVWLIVKEIELSIKNLKKWTAVKKVSTPFPINWPGRSEIHSEPYGCVLIIGPWNYPFMLLMSPLIGAISAGNCTIIKPSDMATYTQDLIIKLINSHFSSDYIHAVKANQHEMSVLLKNKFDYIFFTGGTEIGKIIMQAAAQHLTPITLELGGKSPCIVDETADIEFAARRIIWAKMMNAGQTCIAPDFIFVKDTCKSLLITKLREAVHQFYGNDPEQSMSYGRIINKKHFDRLEKLMQQGTILEGGRINSNTLYISPTLIDHVSWNSAIMQEEIFGPLLPILTFEKIDDVVQALKQRPKPLALYLFTKNRSVEEKILKQLSFGGGCINDCITHITNFNLPFGGVGHSGMGQSHGRYSFETFSHQKSVYKKYFSFDLRLEYPPFSDKKLWWIKQLFRI